MRIFEKRVPRMDSKRSCEPFAERSCDPFAELPVRLLSVPRRGFNGFSSFAFSMIEVYAECGVLRRTVSNAPSKESSTDSHTSSIGVHAIVVIVEGEAIAVV